MTSLRRRPSLNWLGYGAAIFVWLCGLDTSCWAFAPPQTMWVLLHHGDGASPSLLASALAHTTATVNCRTRPTTALSSVLQLVPPRSPYITSAPRTTAQGGVLVTKRSPFSLASLSLTRMQLLSPPGNLSRKTALLSSQSTAEFKEERGHSDVVASSVNGKSPKKPRKASSRLVTTLWIHVISIFILVNSSTRIMATGCWPAALTTRVSLSVWRLMHAVAAMVFAGSIVTTTVVEWMVVRWYNNHRDNNQTSSRTSKDAAWTPDTWLHFWFPTAASVEQWLVLPALTLSIVSGVTQAAISYQHLSRAPRHVKSSLHLLVLFGLWWGVTDRTTQRTVAQQLALLRTDDNDDNTEDKDPSSTTPSMTPISTEEPSNTTANLLGRVLWQRRISNVVSCAFLVALYAVMVLKPGWKTLSL